MRNKWEKWEWKWDKKTPKWDKMRQNENGWEWNLDLFFTKKTWILPFFDEPLKNTPFFAPPLLPSWRLGGDLDDFLAQFLKKKFKSVHKWQKKFKNQLFWNGFCTFLHLFCTKMHTFRTAPNRGKTTNTSKWRCTSLSLLLVFQIFGFWSFLGVFWPFLRLVFEPFFVVFWKNLEKSRFLRPRTALNSALNNLDENDAFEIQVSQVRFLQFCSIFRHFFSVFDPDFSLILAVFTLISFSSILISFSF